MDGNYIPILIASVVVLGIYGLFQFVSGLLDTNRRKLQERLSTESRPFAGGDSAAARSIRLQTEAQGLSAKLEQISLFKSINRRLQYAYPDLSLATFLTFVVILAGIGMAGMLMFFDSISLAFCGLAFGYLPLMLMNSKGNKRQQTISTQLPEALDFLSRILKAGHSLSTGLQMMADELPKPLSAEFRRAYDQHSLGLPMDATLKDMSRRIESTDFAFFVTAVLIQRQTGGDLSEVLNNISSMVRQRMRLQQHVKAKTAEGRFTGYILSGFPIVMFGLVAFLNPKNASVLWTTTGGMAMLGGAFALTIMGLLFIKKLTTVRV
jgi:tight adherence protein B